MKKFVYAVVLLLGLSTMIVSCGKSHEYVDLGLPSGTLWATCNIGAKTPEKYGHYYSWGETKTKWKYTPKTYSFYSKSTFNKDGEIDDLKISKYNTKERYGNVDGKTVLDLENDAAHVRWGGKWRMPTNEEWQELFDECEWTWKDLGKECSGYVVTGTNGKSIFLPAVGGRWGSKRHYEGVFSYYWSSSLYPNYPNNASRILFSKNKKNDEGSSHRYFGLCIRPVCRP